MVQDKSDLNKSVEVHRISIKPHPDLNPEQYNRRQPCGGAPLEVTEVSKLSDRFLVVLDEIVEERASFCMCSPDCIDLFYKREKRKLRGWVYVIEFIADEYKKSLLPVHMTYILCDTISNALSSPTAAFTLTMYCLNRSNWFSNDSEKYWNKNSRDRVLARGRLMVRRWRTRINSSCVPIEEKARIFHCDK
ncbi:hypothetical protein AKJ16_DCAP24430 [Drosera capensis]